jgi:hypothetical protein
MMRFLFPVIVLFDSYSFLSFPVSASYRPVHSAWPAEHDIIGRMMKRGNLSSTADDGIMRCRRSCILIHSQALKSHLNYHARTGSNHPP